MVETLALHPLWGVEHPLVAVTQDHLGATEVLRLEVQTSHPLDKPPRDLLAVTQTVGMMTGMTGRKVKKKNGKRMKRKCSKESKMNSKSVVKALAVAKPAQMIRVSILNGGMSSLGVTRLAVCTKVIPRLWLGESTRLRVLPEWPVYLASGAQRSSGLTKSRKRILSSLLHFLTCDYGANGVYKTFMRSTRHLGDQAG